MVSLEEGSLSTRSGNVVYLDDVLDMAVSKSREIIEEKREDLPDPDAVAEQIGVGAVIFGVLYNNRIKDMTFSYARALNFDGETSVYVQYTCARAASVLTKAAAEGIAFGDAAEGTPCAQEAELLKALSDFPATVHEAAEKYEPSFVARWCVDTAKLFNKFYFDCKILQAEADVRAFRLALTKATLTALTNGLELLGIGVPEKM